MVCFRKSVLEHIICSSAGVQSVTAIDPERLKKWIDIIVQFLPVFLALFAKPDTPTPPAPVQAGASITTIEGLMEYVDKTIELHGLTEEQQNKVMTAVDALAAFLAM